MSLDEVTQEIKSRLMRAAPLNVAVLFDFGDEGRIHVDGTQSPPEVSHDEKEAVTTLVCSLETFKAILAGNKDPNIAYLMGQLKIRGSMGVALKLNSFLEG